MAFDANDQTTRRALVFASIGSGASVARCVSASDGHPPSLCIALLQTPRSGVWDRTVPANYSIAGRMRIID